MHILIAIFTGLAALAGWYLRVKAISTAARDVSKFAKRARNAPGKIAFTHRAGKTGLKSVKDPMEAGAILMVLAAGGHDERPLTDEQKTVFRQEACKIFQISNADAEGLLTHAVWMVRDVDLVSGVALRMAHVLKQSNGIGPAELVDMYEMLCAVSEAEGAPSEDQLRVLDLYKQKVGLTV